MKHGGEYARRLKQLHNRLLRQHGKPEVPEPLDPLDQLLVGILAGCTSLARAMATRQRLRNAVVDLNELRVTPVIELEELIADGVPLAASKARDIIAALNEIRRREDRLDLGFLAQRGRREARDYLESISGVSRAAAACTLLFALNGHAIPVDELTLHVLRKDELVDPVSDIAEVQGFLERHVAASDAAVFALLLNRYVCARGARLDLQEVLRAAQPAPATPPSPPPAEPSPATAPAGRPSARKPAAKATTTPPGPNAAKSPPDHPQPKARPAAQAPADQQPKAGPAGQNPAAQPPKAALRRKK